MSTTIDNAFVAQFERELHEVFQRQGSRLRDTVRFKPDVVGSTTTFQKIGKGAASTKARHGVITPMNQDHTAVVCTLDDFYAGDYADQLDEAKTNIDERTAIARGGAMALGRKVDEQITAALKTTTETAVTWTETSQAAIRNSLINMVEALFANDVMNDGQVYGLLTPRAWAMALTVEEFSSASFVGIASPLASGPPGGQSMTPFKEWLGVKWQMHTGLPGTGTATADTFVYHRDAVGYAAARSAGNIAGRNAVSADITWHGDRAAHFVNNMMSGGACLIDTTGVITGTVDDTATLPTS